MAVDIRKIHRLFDQYLKSTTIVDLLPDAITTRTLDGVIQSWNKSAEKIYNYKAEEVIGENINIIVPLDRQYEEVNLLKLISKGKEIENFETLRRRKNGTLINMLLNMAPIKDINGRIIGAVVISRDITREVKETADTATAMLNVLEDVTSEKEQLQQALNKVEALDKMRSTILNAGHELKSPLGPITIQSQMLLAGDLGKVNQKQKDSLHMILSNVSRLDRVMSDITDVARLESGSVVLVYEQISLAALIREEVEELGPKAKEAGIKLIMMPMTVPMIYADRQKILEVIANLLENAIKFTPVKGKIVVKAKKVKNQVLVQVTDTGIGISSTTNKMLFTRFFQADSSIRRRFGGTGLGLFICRGIIEAHHGRIKAESEGLGKGSTFSFMLPIAKAKVS